MKLFLSVAVAVAVAASAIPSISPAAKSRVKTFVVGGADAELGEVPYQLALLRLARFFCGAVLLEPGLAVTAAHCVLVKYPYKLMGGTVDVTLGEGQFRDVKEIIMHPDFNQTSLVNDIALLTLTQNFDITSTVDTIPIPPENFLTSGDLLLSGWGRTGENHPISSILQTVSVPFVSDDSCREYYSDYNQTRVTNSMLCAGFREGGQGSCKGDSGGPLVSLETNYLVGIASWSRGCARPNSPSVFTEVAYFTNWINQQKKLHL